MSDLRGNFAGAHAACHHDPQGPTAPVRSNRANTIAVVHAIAFALQGLIVGRFLDLDAPAAAGLFLGFAVVGVGLGFLWRRWATMPHWLDMCIAMCTVGSFGMLLGIWTDHRFGPVVAPEDVAWTYGFMLVACNVGMFALTRCRHAFSWTDVSFLAMLIGGNLGMIAGMKAGAAAVIRIVAAAPPLEMVAKLAGMTLGMVIGMLIGNVILLVLLRRLVGFKARD
jgi:hypothetical protein